MHACHQMHARIYTHVSSGLRANVNCSRSPLSCPLALALQLTLACNACSQFKQASSPPLVGSPAPDFTAQAVFDQEFSELSLSQYKARSSSLKAEHKQSHSTGLRLHVVVLEFA